MEEKLEDEFDIVRLDEDGSVNVTGVVDPPPKSMKEADEIIRSMLADCPNDRLAVMARRAMPWKVVHWARPQQGETEDRNKV